MPGWLLLTLEHRKPLMSDFDFEPAGFVPFRDRQVLDRVRRMTREQITQHPNPDLDIRVVRDASVAMIQFADMVARIQDAAAKRQHVAFILGNPNPGYADLAHLLNRLRIDCRHLHVFNMDEWADQDGNTAPESYPQGFMHAMKKYFYHELDPDLRPPEQQIQGPTTRNINDFSKRLADLGGADACYSGTGWSGHTAFIDPDVPEFETGAEDPQAALEEWKAMGTRIVTLSRYTVLQNSLHASFGRCGDTAAVPPKAATIGPADILGAKFRLDRSAITIGGSATSWQRFITRLLLHGPITPQVPASVLQAAPTTFIIAESIAADIEPTWYLGY